MFIHSSEDYTKSLDMMTVNENVSSALNFTQALREFNDIMISVTEGYITVTEDTKDGGSGKKATNFIKRIIEFVKDMLARFKDKFQTTFQSTIKWAKDRADEFDKMSYDGIEVEVVPYWKGNSRVPAEIANSLQSLVSRVESDRNVSGMTDKEEFYKKYLTKYMTKQDDITTFSEGLKNLLRVGNVQGVDREKVSGNALKTLVTGTVLKYVVSDHESSMKAVENVADRTTKIMEEVEKEMGKRKSPANESYLQSIGETLDSTILALSPNIVLEDDKANDKDSSGKDRTKVNVTSDKDDTDDDIKNKEAVRNIKSDDGLKVYHHIASSIREVSASAATISEERFVFYSNLLKQIWKLGNTRGGRKGREKEEEE